jgi:hypothetical protein
MSSKRPELDSPRVKTIVQYMLSPDPQPAEYHILAAIVERDRRIEDDTYRRHAEHAKA